MNIPAFEPRHLSVPGQAGYGFEQTDLVKDDLADGTGV